MTALGSSHRAVDNVRDLKKDKKLVGFVAQLAPSGYVLMATDDEAPPIKLHSDQGSFEDLPPEFIEIIKLEMAENLEALAKLRQTNTHIDSKHNKEWRSLVVTDAAGVAATGDGSVSTASTVLLTTSWNQNDPYNYYCPTASGGPSGRAYAGCTACALSQILRYWNSPSAVGSGHTYNDIQGSCTGSRSISDVGMNAYDWANMPGSITTGSSTVQKQAIGRLMYHAAVALESDFEYDATGAYPSTVPSVLQTYFSYSCSDHLEKSSFTSAQWYTKIASDIDASRPVFYSMWQADWTQGHAVVCDGYRSGNQIHLNLGWSGSGTLWYNIDSVNSGSYNG